MLFNFSFHKKRFYGHIISLGYNCEVSFQFFKKYNFVESSLFAWCNVVDCTNLTYVLKNLDLLTSKGLKNRGSMYKDLATSIYFHSKDGYTEKEALAELTDRILYLKEKFIKTTYDGKKNLYIFKYPPLKHNTDVVYTNIISLYQQLNKIVKNNFDLLIILEKEMNTDLHFNEQNIYIRRVIFYTPENLVTSKPYDKKHYGKIFSEFCPDFKLEKTKNFKFER